MDRTLVLAACLAVLGCAREAAEMPTGEGHLAVPGGRIWYSVTGTGSGTPVVLLRGGPGFSSVYLKSFETLGDDRPVAPAGAFVGHDPRPGVLPRPSRPRGLAH